MLLRNACNSFRFKMLVLVYTVALVSLVRKQKVRQNHVPYILRFYYVRLKRLFWMLFGPMNEST
jgi:hypothetical protein